MLPAGIANPQALLVFSAAVYNKVSLLARWLNASSTFCIEPSLLNPKP